VNAETIAVGSEMLTPYRQDTNSLYLTEKLNELGVEMRFKSVVGDSSEDLTAAAKLAMRRSDIIILIGGLGPTEDDLTREAVAEALKPAGVVLIAVTVTGGAPGIWGSGAVKSPAGALADQVTPVVGILFTRKVNCWV